MFLNTTDDFLFQIASINPVGAPFSNSAGTGSLFAYSDGNFGFFTSNQETLNSTSTPVASSVSAPASLAFLGLGMLVFELRRRVTR